MLQSKSGFLKHKAPFPALVTILLVLLTHLFFLQLTSAQSYQVGSSMDAFTKAGNALKRGLAKPQSSDDTARTSSTNSASKSSTTLIETKKAPNPLSQLAAFQPLQQKPPTRKPKQKPTKRASARPAKAPLSTNHKTKPKTVQIKVDREEDRIKKLRKELQQTKEQLAIAELEVSRLSAILQSSARARLSAPRAASGKSVELSRKISSRRAVPAEPLPANDLQVATIASKKAYLRLGPGKQHSTLMALREGSRLAVEMRQGDWYRVFAPNGQRAWIHSSVLSFGKGSHKLNDGSSVTTRGVVNGQR